jgi:hypothetical protein
MNGITPTSICTCSYARLFHVSFSGALRGQAERQGQRAASAHVIEPDQRVREGQITDVVLRFFLHATDALQMIDIVADGNEASCTWFCMIGRMAL